MAEAKGFLDFLDDDLKPEKFMHKAPPRGGSAVGFLDFLDDTPGESPKIERVVKRKGSATSSSNSAMGFLDLAKEESLDISFPQHVALKQAFQGLLIWTTEEWQSLLLCYRSFATTIDIVHLWASKYFDSKSQPESTKNLLERIRLWVQLYPSDFTPEVVDRLREVWMFVVERPTQFQSDIQLKESLAAAAVRKTPSTAGAEGRRATSDSDAAHVVNLSELEPLDIARALTLEEFELFADVSPLEFIAKGGWSKDTKTPNLDRLSERFNRISRWVTTTVVCADDSTKLELFLKFIVVAYRCKQLNNFNTMMEVVSGLNQSSVLLLKQLWSSIPAKVQKKWEEMNALSDPLGNFRNYRRELKAKAMLENRKKVPVLPYIPVFLRDCLFFREGNSKPDLSLMVQFWSTIEQIRRFQQIPFSFSLDKKTQNFLGSQLIVKDEEELFRLAARSRPTVASREEFFQDMDLDANA